MRQKRRTVRRGGGGAGHVEREEWDKEVEKTVGWKGGMSEEGGAGTGGGAEEKS